MLSGLLGLQGSSESDVRGRGLISLTIAGPEIIASGASQWMDPGPLRLREWQDLLTLALSIPNSAAAGALLHRVDPDTVPDPDPGPPLLREWQDLLAPMQQMGLAGSKEDDRLCGMAIKALRVGRWC